MASLLRIKPMAMVTQEAGGQGEHTLKRSLSALNLITLGIGAVIGAGIFTLTGQAAALHAGPAGALGLVGGGVTPAFSRLCFAGFSPFFSISSLAPTSADPPRGHTCR